MSMTKYKRLTKESHNDFKAYEGTFVEYFHKWKNQLGQVTNFGKKSTPMGDRGKNPMIKNLFLQIYSLGNRGSLTSYQVIF